ncbi:hypothetical protein GCM10010435_29860 [Winogradskya consettensis]|uniref:Uncharacterized protein n=1 Tax=Winogradskya consettensis TaxID=113560 RepID=A0A919SHB5_9ACTN|nr:hypothetical protein [Actinoplanes consettensis]GIM70698.1 hypothetical protein Aco04nite_21640 [Actinoplanes consettensis]
MPRRSRLQRLRKAELASVAPEVAADAIRKAALHEAAGGLVASVVNAMPIAELRQIGGHLLLVEGDNDGRVYRPGNRVARDSLRDLLHRLLTESMERAAEMAKEDELIRHFIESAEGHPKLS